MAPLRRVLSKQKSHPAESVGEATIVEEAELGVKSSKLLSTVAVDPRAERPGELLQVLTVGVGAGRKKTQEKGEGKNELVERREGRGDVATTKAALRGAGEAAVDGGGRRRQVRRSKTRQSTLRRVMLDFHPVSRTKHQDRPLVEKQEVGEDPIHTSKVYPQRTSNQPSTSSIAGT